MEVSGLQAIDLDLPDTLPSSVAERIDRTDDQTIISELQQICLDSGVVGIHYTRNFRERIAKNGLQSKTGDERRAAFLDEFSGLFTKDQLATLQSRWNDRFTVEENDIRDNRIYFNFTRCALELSGADELIGMYGGEVVSMAGSRGEEIGDILSTIGEPLLVTARISATKIENLRKNVLGRIWLSSYRRLTSKDAELICEPEDVFVRESIPAADILSIEALDEPS